MAALFNDPFMEPQFSNRQSKTLPYQVDTHTRIVVCVTSGRAVTEILGNRDADTNVAF